MNFRSLFFGKRSTRRFQARAAVARTSRPVARLERLEPRTLLAGDVTVALRLQSAVLTGDAADNSIQILVADGNVVARGIDGTTINGSAADFVLATGTSTVEGSVIAHLAAGNDTLSIDGVTIGGSVHVSGGQGNDRLGLLNSTTVVHHVVMSGNVGDDIISLQDAIIGRNASLLGGSGNDVISVASTLVARHLTILGGGGNDDIVVDTSQAAGRAHIRGQSGDDDIVLMDSEVGKNVVVTGNAGDDVIVVDTSTGAGHGRILGGIGNDNVAIQGASSVARRLVMRGGPGADNLEMDDAATAGKLHVRRFSGATVDAAVLDERITSSTTGALAAAEAAIAAFGSQLILSVNQSSFSEAAGNGAAILTVTRSSSNTDSDLTVSLTTSPSDQTKLTLAQSSVIIPAGQTTATVAVDAVNNSLQDADTVVTVTATGTGFGSDSVDITVTNDDVDSLTLTPAQTQIFEDTGSPTTTGNPQTVDVTVARTGSATAALTVNLSTPDTDRLTVPATVVIPAGQTTATFSVSTIVNTQVDADNTVVTINATATGLPTAQTQITLVDTDAPTLLAEFDAPTISEDGSATNGQAVFRVTRNTATTSALVVNLTATPASGVQLSSSTLTIPAGAASATVTVSGVEDSIVNGDRTVSVTATATGFASGSETIVVIDNDTPVLNLAVTSGGTVAEDAGTGAVTATVSRNTSDTSTALVVALAITGDSRLTGPTTVTIPVGQTSASIAFDVVNNNVVEAVSTGTATITASSSSFTSSSATVSITDDDVATITLTPADADYNENAGAGGASLTLTRNTTNIAETVSISYSNTSLVSGDTSVSFAVGESQKVVNVDVIDNTSLQDNPDVIVTASAPGHATVQAIIGITNDDMLTLTTDTTSNVTVQSVQALVTKDDTFTVTGMTAPGATVQIESDGDNAFDDQSIVAASDGSYSLDVPLTHTTANGGANTIQVRAVVPAEGMEQISDPIHVHLAVGTVVRFVTNQDFDNDGNSDFYDVELLDTDAPIAVTNFLSYVNDGSYENMFIHRSPLLQRSPPEFVIQGGGFTVNNGTIGSVASKGTIQGEFSAEHSNVRGTLSMAHTGQPDTGSSQWFVNVQDNSGDAFVALDAAQHTVFGEVIAGGMSVVDAISHLSIVDLRPLYNNNSNFTTTPMTSDLMTPLTGTLSITTDSDVVTGTGTAFTTQLEVGDVVFIGNQDLFVTAISSDTQMTVDITANATQSNLTATLFRRPVDDEFVVFSNIGEILDSL
ncbi:MAG: peptidylprolyl isomerase [Planctomycetaceae bacterium]